MQEDLVALLEKGYAYQRQDNLGAAADIYRQVLQRDDNNEFALNLLGVVYVRSSSFDAAVKVLVKALNINSDDPETYNNLGLAYKGLNQYSEAQRAFSTSIRLQPEQPVTLNNLGNSLAAVDQHGDAIPYFELALKLDGNYVDCLINLAASLKEVGRLEHALLAIQHAIDLDSGKSRSFNSKGEVLLRATQFEQAKEAFEHAIKLDGNIVARVNHSTALKQLGQEQAAVEELQQVLESEPQNAEAHNHFGVLLGQLGDTEQAAKHFRLALEHTPNHASSFYQLSKLKDQRLTEAEIEKILSLLEDPDVLDIFRFSLFFALACEHEKRAEYSTSIDHFAKGQAIKAARNPYDGNATESYVRVAKETFPLSTTVTASDDFPVPVFVVGMPRSGTTLTEQIISSHSRVTGAGEIPHMSDLINAAAKLSHKKFPDSLQSLTDEQLGSLRVQFLNRLIDQHGSTGFIVDKSPLNYNYIGAIVRVFPEAKIIYCKRDAMDNCVSIFKLPFDTNQGYAHDLAALGHFYRQHEVLMAYWLECYPSQILAVEYEQTVDDLEGQARRMLKFLGVDFEEQVLRFYDSERIVMTPSAEQVRQPIYKTSIDSWQRYGAALDPLINALEKSGANGG